MGAPVFPSWLHILSEVSLGMGVACAVLIALHETRRPQPMWIMNLVWPLTALFSGALGLAVYAAWGAGRDDKQPFAVKVVKGTTHCGAGCTLGDLAAEIIATLWPGVAVALGWKTLFSEKTFAVWILDLALAILFGVAFQYFTLKPMGRLTPGRALAEALKADLASIAAWQVGMYGGMALIQFRLFRPLYGAIAQLVTPEFWLAMQLAMLAGFATAFPANWALIKLGVKRPM